MTAVMQEAAASLAAIAAPAAMAPAAAAEAPPRAWSCHRCLDLLREKAEACEVAEAATQAKYTAEHLRSAAYLEVQAAKQQLRERVEALEAEQERALQEREAAHARALEEREAAHAEALRVAWADAKQANALAEERRREIVTTKQHQSTLSKNAFHDVEELRRVQKKLSKATEDLKKLKDKQAEELEKHRDEQGRLQREVQMAAEAWGLLHGQVEQLRSELQGEKIRRGRAEAAVSRQQQRAASGGQEEETTSTYGRALVKELKDKVSGLEKKLSRREAELRDAGESAKRARLEHAMLAGEMRRGDRIMGFSSEKKSNWYEVQKVSASPLKKKSP